MDKINSPIFYKNMIISGANNLYNYYPHIDKLNVFPVPDGDTGTNMNLTISNAVIEIEKLSEGYTFKEILDSFSYNLIMNARGNSGVIFSQIFRGIASAVNENDKEIDFNLLGKMFNEGKKTAYKAVMNPVEGTILTVIKDISTFLKINNSELKNKKITFIFDKIIFEGNKSLKKTTELLPALKEIGVVDSGAYGLMKFLEGMYFYLENGKIVKKTKDNFKNFEKITINIKKELEFGYCTEAIVINKNADKLNVQNIRNALQEQEKNNSIIVVTDKNIVKVHVHTRNPGNVLIYLQQFGEFKKIKIDNMKEQVHNNIIVKNKDLKFYDNNDTKLLLILPTDKLGKYFKVNFGVACIIFPDINKNISTQEILKAIKEISAKNVVVLPNNSNVILAAQSAAKLIDTQQNVNVLPTKTIQEGLLVSRLYDLEETYRKNWSFLKSMLNDSISISIYKATIDGKNNGFNVKKDDYIAVHGKKVIAKNNNVLNVMFKAFSQKIGKYSELITIITSNNTSKSEKNLINKYIDENFDVEYEFIEGDIEKYDYFILIE